MDSLVKNYLLEKYDETKKKADDDYNRSYNDAIDKQGYGDILKGISMMANANSVSRGNRAPDMSAFDKVGQRMQQSVSDADADRKAAIKDYLMRDELTQTQKQRNASEAESAALNATKGYDVDAMRGLIKQINPSINTDGMTLKQMQNAYKNIHEAATLKQRADETAASNRRTDAMNSFNIMDKNRNYDLKIEENKIKQLQAENSPDKADQIKGQALYNQGRIASDQYDAAIAKGKKEGNYDPTSTSEFLDNSSKRWYSSLIPNAIISDAAIEADSAMSSWVENFLRDKSGAAIPPSERLAYASDYFPMPGDTEQTVIDKKEKRKRVEADAAMRASGKKSIYVGEEAKADDKKTDDKKTNKPDWAQ